jgi:hypothetical protein
VLQHQVTRDDIEYAIRNPQSTIRNTQYAIRNTQYVLDLLEHQVTRDDIEYAARVRFATKHIIVCVPRVTLNVYTVALRDVA